ncbi:unnamed protein product [Penicillium bialowiezense]
MESGGRIKQAAQQCIKGFIRCLDTPVLMENEWAENRLADMNLWISGTGACARGRASLDSRLASKPEACDVIVNLLHLLDAIIEECWMQSQVLESHSDLDEENPDHAEYEGQDRAFSPWSEDSSSDSQSEDAHVTRIPSASPLREIMYNIESMQDQFARIAVAVRRSGTRSRLQKADGRFKVAEHQELEGHLVGMLLTQLGYRPKERDPSQLNEVQLRLVRCNLKRRNRFIYTQEHSMGLDAHSVCHGDRTDVPKKAEATQGETIDGKPNLESPNDIPKHTNNTIITGTSASKVSDDFNLPQPVHATPATSSILSTTMIDLDYPRPPRFKDDDLSPYTCISANCDEPDVLFNTKEAWKEHILKDHSSLTYWICFACADGTQFDDKDTFIQHTRSEHAATIPPGHILVLCDLSKKTTPTGIPRCPLCNWPEEEGVEVEKDVLLSHIAKEIHSFSLRALPWADDNGQASDHRIKESSEKVYEWLIQNDDSENSVTERPWREARAWHSEYFEHNSYFANSSGSSSSSEAEFNGSIESELKKLRDEGESIVHKSCEAGEVASQFGNAEENTRREHSPTTPKDEDYMIGWICATRMEYIAAQAMLDVVHRDIGYFPPSKKSDFTLGRIGNHDIVISGSPKPEYGGFTAAQVESDMMLSFPNIRFRLMAGIGSGVPSQTHDIRLGDVVVGVPRNFQSGAIQYDFHNSMKDQAIEFTGFITGPTSVLLAAVDGLRAEYEIEANQLDTAVCEVLERNPRLRQNYQRPDPTSDRLYQNAVIHPIDDEASCNSNCGDNPSRLIIRPPRTALEDNPMVHYGLIASSNKIMRDATLRDKLSAEQDILCFENEAAGLMKDLPCLLIRGICDYADTHQNRDWQRYATLVAASYAKDLLSQIAPWQVEQEATYTNFRNENNSFQGAGTGIQLGQSYHGPLNWTSESE